MPLCHSCASRQFCRVGDPLLDEDDGDWMSESDSESVFIFEEEESDDREPLPAPATEELDALTQWRLSQQLEAHVHGTVSWVSPNALLVELHPNEADGAEPIFSQRVRQLTAVAQGRESHVVLVFSPDARLESVTFRLDTGQMIERAARLGHILCEKMLRDRAPHVSWAHASSGEILASVVRALVTVTDLCPVCFDEHPWRPVFRNTPLFRPFFATCSPERRETCAAAFEGTRADWSALWALGCDDIQCVKLLTETLFHVGKNIERMEPFPSTFLLSQVDRGYFGELEAPQKTSQTKQVRGEKEIHGYKEQAKRRILSMHETYKACDADIRMAFEAWEADQRRLFTFVLATLRDVWFHANDMLVREDGDPNLRLNGFHGTNVGNLFPIMRMGIRVMSNTNYMTYGAVHGSGVYVGLTYGKSRAYAEKHAQTNFTGMLHVKYGGDRTDKYDFSLVKNSRDVRVVAVDCTLADTKHISEKTVVVPAHLTWRMTPASIARTVSTVSPEDVMANIMQQATEQWQPVVFAFGDTMHTNSTVFTNAGQQRIGAMRAAVRAMRELSASFLDSNIAAGVKAPADAAVVFHTDEDFAMRLTIVIPRKVLLQTFVNPETALGSSWSTGPLIFDVHLPPDFPNRPPFVRVVTPRFVQQTGHIMAHGFVCSELMGKSWLPTMSLETVVTEITRAMVSGNGKLQRPRQQRRSAEPDFTISRDDAYISTVDAKGDKGRYDMRYG